MSQKEKIKNRCFRALTWFITIVVRKKFFIWHCLQTKHTSKRDRMKKFKKISENENKHKMDMWFDEKTSVHNDSISSWLLCNHRQNCDSIYFLSNNKSKRRKTYSEYEEVRFFGEINECYHVSHDDLLSPRTSVIDQFFSSRFLQWIRISWLWIRNEREKA
jgi:hypothetical protein